MNAPRRDFFAYHPKSWRLMLGLGAVCALVLTAWAMASAGRTGAPIDFARAGLSGGLVLAMLTVHHRLRPRAEWGVRVTPLTVTVSRPTNGTIEVPWSAVTDVRRAGDKRDTVVLFCGEEKRVLISAHLFPSKQEFEAVAAAIDELRPAPPHDA